MLPSAKAALLLRPGCRASMVSYIPPLAASFCVQSSLSTMYCRSELEKRLALTSHPLSIASRMAGKHVWNSRRMQLHYVERMLIRAVLCCSRTRTQTRRWHEHWRRAAEGRQHLMTVVAAAPSGRFRGVLIYCSALLTLQS